VLFRQLYEGPLQDCCQNLLLCFLQLVMRLVLLCLWCGWQLQDCLG
jgi:hypothetical protein